MQYQNFKIILFTCEYIKKPYELHVKIVGTIIEMYTWDNLQAKTSLIDNQIQLHKQKCTENYQKSETNSKPTKNNCKTIIKKNIRDQQPVTSNDQHQAARVICILCNPKRQPT